MDKRLLGTVLVVVSGLIFGHMPLLATTVYAQGGLPGELVLLRSLIPLPLLWVCARRVSITRPMILPLVWLSLSFMVTINLLWYSYLYIPTGMATTLHFIYPVVVVAGCVLFCRARLTLRKTVCTALCALGMACFASPGDTGFNLTGASLAVLSAVVFAFYAIYLSRSRLQTLPPLVLTFWLFVFITLESCVWLGATGQLRFNITPIGWAVMSALSLVMTIAVIFFQIGVKYIGPSQTCILSTLEPVTSIVVGCIVYDEPFGWWEASGTILVLAAGLLLTLFPEEDYA